MIKSYIVYVSSAKYSEECPYLAGLPSAPSSNFQRHDWSWQCLHT